METLSSHRAAISGLSYSQEAGGLTWDFFLWMWMSPPSVRVHTAQVTM